MVKRKKDYWTNLAQMRIKRGLKRAELVEKLGITKRQLINAEHEKYVDSDVKDLISAFYGLDTEDLFGKRDLESKKRDDVFYMESLQCEYSQRLQYDMGSFDRKKILRKISKRLDLWQNSRNTIENRAKKIAMCLHWIVGGWTPKEVGQYHGCTPTYVRVASGSVLRELRKDKEIRRIGDELGLTWDWDH